MPVYLGLFNKNLKQSAALQHSTRRETQCNIGTRVWQKKVHTAIKNLCHLLLLRYVLVDIAIETTRTSRQRERERERERDCKQNLKHLHMIDTPSQRKTFISISFPAHQSNGVGTAARRKAAKPLAHAKREGRLLKVD